MRTRLHRGAGYAWVTVMVVTAFSALFIPAARLPHIAGFGPIHLLVPFVLVMLVVAMRHMLQGRLQAHRQTMLQLYIGACLVAGAFTLLPGRLLGQWVRSLLA